MIVFFFLLGMLNLYSITGEKPCAIYLFYLFIGFIYRSLSDRSSGSRVLWLGPISGLYLRFRSSVCYRTPSLQSKYQTTGVNYTALYDQSLLQPYSE